MGTVTVYSGCFLVTSGVHVLDVPWRQDGK